MFDAFKIPLGIEIPDLLSEKVAITDIRCGLNHNLLLDRQGRVYSFGKNGYGQCAQGGSYVYGAKVIQYFEDQQEKVEHIDCGTYHSYCRTTEGKHYLFGSNKYNECCTFGRHPQLYWGQDRTRVFEPFCINKVIAKMLKGSKIKSIVLGQQNTRIVMYDKKRSKKVHETVIDKYLIEEELTLEVGALERLTEVYNITDSGGISSHESDDEIDLPLVILQPYRSDGSHTDTGSGGDNGTTTPFVRYRHSECLSILKGSCLYL